MDHYGLELEKINPRQAHESNGDAEQSHNRFKEAVDQRLASTWQPRFCR